MSQRLLKGTVQSYLFVVVPFTYFRHLFATAAVFVSTATVGKGFSPYRTELCSVHFFSSIFSDFLIGHPAEPSYAG
jgi:hypothetical protein